jgi:hypothetical protein
MQYMYMCKEIRLFRLRSSETMQLQLSIRISSNSLTPLNRSLPTGVHSPCTEQTSHWHSNRTITRATWCPLEQGSGYVNWVRFEVFIAMKIHIVAFWDMTQYMYSIMCGNQCLRPIFFFHHQCTTVFYHVHGSSLFLWNTEPTRMKTLLCDIPEDHDLNPNWTSKSLGITTTFPLSVISSSQSYIIIVLSHSLLIILCSRATNTAPEAAFIFFHFVHPVVLQYNLFIIPVTTQQTTRLDYLQSRYMFRLYSHHQANNMITHIYTLQNCCTNETGYNIIKIFKIVKNTWCKIPLNYIKKT